jgi:sulfur carrier protein
MKITVNGEPRTVPETFTVGELIEQLNLSGRRLAVEVNMDIVPRSQHQQHRLKQDDMVEVVHAIGGG